MRIAEAKGMGRIQEWNYMKKGLRLSSKPLDITLVAGAGFEPTASGL